MKIVIHLVLLFTLSALVCNNPVEPDPENTLYGEWILKMRSGGFFGRTDTIDVKKDKFILGFYPGQIARASHNDSLNWATTFYIERKKSIYSTDSLDFIVYRNNLPRDVIIFLSKDSLTLSDNFFDGFTNFYIRYKR